MGLFSDGFKELKKASEPLYKAPKSIQECRVKMGMTQEKLAETLITKKSTISAYENDKIDIKVSVLKDLAKVLCTNVSYLVDGDENDIAPEIMQVAVMLQEIQNKELRKVAIEQMKILVGLNDTFK